MTRPLALVLFATGTNRDLDVTQALEQAGACAEIVPLNRLRSGERRWQDYQMLVLPGGFSYADALGAGKLLALDLQAYFADEVSAFVQQGKPVIGICNGFQALVKANILPNNRPADRQAERRPAASASAASALAASATPTQPSAATLTFNTRGHFECRWVTLLPRSQTCLWTRQLAEDIYCPVAHGEGQFVTADEETLRGLQANDQVALVYAGSDHQPAGGAYPANPNGSAADIAGICNPQGNVLGLMPHPENHIFPYQHPRWSRGERSGSGLALFASGVAYAAQM